MVYKHAPSGHGISCLGLAGDSAYKGMLVTPQHTLPSEQASFSARAQAAGRQPYDESTHRPINKTSSVGAHPQAVGCCELCQFVHRPCGPHLSAPGGKHLTEGSPHALAPCAACCLALRGMHRLALICGQNWAPSACPMAYSTAPHGCMMHEPQGGSAPVHRPHAHQRCGRPGSAACPPPTRAPAGAAGTPLSDWPAAWPCPACTPRYSSARREPVCVCQATGS